MAPPLASVSLTLLLLTTANLIAKQASSTTTTSSDISHTTSGQCVFGFATCGTVSGPDGGQIPVPCQYNGEPKVIEDLERLKKFDELCPSLDVLNNNGNGLCCSEDQINSFLDKMQQARDLLGSCPSCLINFSQLFCDLTCNPHQADFVKVTKVSPFNGTKFNAVEEISYTIGLDFVNGMFNSCKDVIWSQMQQPALNVLCGEKCTPKEWVEHLGEKGLSPFFIKYKYVEHTHNDAIPCNSSVGDHYPRLKHLYNTRCSYVDCPSEVAPQPDPETPWIVKIGGVYVLVTFLFIILAVLISVVYDHYGDYDHCLIDSILTKVFRKWALFCSQYASLVILFGLAGVTLSCVGLTKLQILTDPVNLWSQSNSQAHQEKTYFENTFGPFYRVEQVIIYPSAGYQPWIPFNGNPDKTFSNTFQLDFLMSALKLQKSILDLEVTYNDKPYKITDICIQPLGNNICSVQSPLDWFQGNEANFRLESNSNVKAVKSTNDTLVTTAKYITTIDEAEPSNDKNLTLFSTITTTEQQPAYLKHFMSCFKNSLEPKDKDYHQLSCLGPYGGPILPHVGLAGYPDKSYWEANSLVITIPVKNDHSIEANRIAKAWEKKFIDLLSNYNDPKLKLAFYSERSIEDEIERQSQSDVFTIAISYLVMFAYVAISLGRTTNLKNFFIESRIVLGLGGVLIVLASVLASIGILSFFGVRATLIIIEVIPFLALAVGVDNIFIIVQALQRSTLSPNQVDVSVEERISIVVGDVAPSLLLASLSESACFLIGTLTPMPAVRVFAMTASLALMVDFILQTTVFIALLSLDTKRQLVGRYDLICCLQAPKTSQTSLMSSPDVGSEHSLPRPEVSASSIGGDNNPTPMTSPNIDNHERQLTDQDPKYMLLRVCDQDPLYRLFERFIAPFLMKSIVRYIAMVAFVIWLCVSLAVIRNIDVGLDQTMSVPEDSYMQQYFTAQKTDLRVGPPVYFVLKRGLDFTDEFERSFTCSSSGCKEFSLISQITQASRTSNETYIATPSNSWIDDYKTWGGNSKCCRMFKQHNPANFSVTAATNFGQANSRSLQAYRGLMMKNSKFCPYDTVDITHRCSKCDLINDLNNNFNKDVFYDYLGYFLHDTPRTDCVNGGAASYSNSVRLHRNDQESLSSSSSNQTSDQETEKYSIDSAFTAFHVPLKDSKDFIESMKQARKLAQTIENMLNTNLRSQQSTHKEKLEVFPYCFTYVFYEQYQTIWQQTFRNLSISMATIFIVTYLLMGCNLYISTVVVGTIASIVIDLMGLMYFWDIQLNAISLVNLVMAVGISVEFCSHVARVFALSQHTKPVDRAQEALVKMGSSVLSGITLTKVAGISILAFAKSRIFKVYYFRMYMGIVLVGAFHGIIFMPIILSLTSRDKKSSRSRDENQAESTQKPSQSEEPR